MPHVLVAGPLHPSGHRILDEADGVTAEYIEETTEESYSGRVAGADAVLIRTQPMSAATVARAGRLRIVSRHGVGYDSVDVAALNARGIALAVCGDVNSHAVAEHAMLMLLAAARRLIRADKAVRAGDWGWRNRLEAVEVRGMNLLLFGYGRIGRHVGALAQAFGMNVRAHDPFLARHGWPDGAVPMAADLAEALGWADAISLSVPKTDRPAIGPEEFAAMKDGAILVNTARGGIVDEAALVAALEGGRVGAAGIDHIDATQSVDPNHGVAPGR